MAMAVLLLLLVSPAVTAQQADPTAERAPLARGYRTRALAGGWGHSWLHGWPGHGKAISDIQYVGFNPQMGWFVTNWLELYGKGTAHAYNRPHTAVLGGFVGIGADITSFGTGTGRRTASWVAAWSGRHSRRRSLDRIFPGTPPSQCSGGVARGGRR